MASVVYGMGQGGYGVTSRVGRATHICGWQVSCMGWVGQGGCGVTSLEGLDLLCQHPYGLPLENHSSDSDEGKHAQCFCI